MNKAKVYLDNCCFNRPYDNQGNLLIHLETEAKLKSEGMRILAEQLGLVNAERFIALMIREPFDYTEWQRDLYKDVPLDDFLRNAMCFRHKENLT